MDSAGPAAQGDQPERQRAGAGDRRPQRSGRAGERGPLQRLSAPLAEPARSRGGSVNGRRSVRRSSPGRRNSGAQPRGSAAGTRSGEPGWPPPGRGARPDGSSRVEAPTTIRSARRPQALRDLGLPDAATASIRTAVRRRRRHADRSIPSRRLRPPMAAAGTGHRSSRHALRAEALDGLRRRGFPPRRRGRTPTPTQCMTDPHRDRGGPLRTPRHLDHRRHHDLDGTTEHHTLPSDKRRADAGMSRY